MPELRCGKCGTTARPTDFYCRRCGSPVDYLPFADEGTLDAKPEPGREELAACCAEGPQPDTITLIMRLSMKWIKVASDAIAKAG